MSFDFSTLITDRTQADVSDLSALMAKKLDQWTPEELEQFNNGSLKGGYWWTDLNRVTACMEYIAGIFRGLGYSLPGYKRIQIIRPTDNVLPPLDPYIWYNSDVPRQSEVEQYLENIAVLQNAIATANYTVTLPKSIYLLTFVEANNIEKLLLEIHLWLETFQKIFIRSSMPWAMAGASYFYFKN